MKSEDQIRVHGKVETKRTFKRYEGFQVKLETNGLFGSYFRKLSVRTVFENAKNTIFVFSKFNIFYVLCNFQKKNNCEPNEFFLFSLLSLFFRTENSF